MDLLLQTYSNNSDDEDEPKPKPKPKPLPTPTTRPIYLPPPPKRSKPNNPEHVDVGPPVPGRYISKRERALMASTSAPTTDPIPDPTSSALPSPLRGSISRANLRHDILLSLRALSNGSHVKKKLPCTKSIDLKGHSKAVNALQWSTTHAHLLASAGMDNVIYIWNVWNEQQKLARAFTHHNAAVKDVKWSPQGQFVLSCGYDCSTRLLDVEKGSESQSFTDSQAVTTIKFHPQNSNLFLSGGYKGFLKLWDIRVGKVVHEYMRGLGPILDVEFMVDGKQFISSSDESRSNVSENSLVVWDVAREVPLSNQVYGEAYTCPSVRCHPWEPFFVAQSNGNYAAIFSTKHPFRMDKYKRYESHGVFGFPIKCGFSLDGEILASGSADGSVYFYNVRSSNIVKKIKVYDQPCVDVAFHPSMPNVIATCSWSGNVLVLE